MIAASALFVVAALVLLILGTFQDGLEMIFASIAASVVAALLLFFGVLVDRRRPAPAGYAYTPPEEPALTGVGVAPERSEPTGYDSEPTGYELIPEEPITKVLPAPAAFEEPPPVVLAEDAEDQEPIEAAGAVTVPRRSTASAKAAASSAKRKAAPKKTTAKKTTAKTTAKKTTAKKTTAKKTTAKKTTAKKTTAKKTTKR